MVGRRITSCPILYKILMAIPALSMTVSTMNATTTTTTATTTTRIDVYSKNERRAETSRDLFELDLIAGYEPFTVVSDVNAIDIDMKFFLEQLDEIVRGGQAGAANFNVPKEIYLKGGSSAPYAQLVLDPPLLQMIAGGTLVLGFNDNQETVRGKVVATTQADSPVLQVAYEISPDSQDYVQCRVGALSLINEEEISGCFQAAGSIKVDGLDTDLAYTYSVGNSNWNRITLGSISRNGDSTMFGCDYCPFAPFNAYHAYYGSATYGDDIIQKAFEGGATNFLRGNIDFGAMSPSARATAAHLGTLVLNLWMEVQRQMEVTVQSCMSGDANGARHSWDMAVAFYTGSMEGRDGYNRNGRLLHQYADDLCEEMKTCGQEGDDAFGGKSYVNFETLREFRFAQRFFANNECVGMRTSKEALSRIMLVPLIQDFLITAYERWVGGPNDNDGLKVKGAVLSAAVVPMVYANCDEEAAAILHNEMGLHSTKKPDFNTVKYTLEVQYTCLSITCRDVGGYFNPAINDYYNGAGPCFDGSLSSFTPGPAPLQGSQPPNVATASPKSVSGDSSQAPAIVSATEQEERDNPEGAVVWVGIFAGSFGLALLSWVIVQAIRRKQKGKQADPVGEGDVAEFGFQPGDDVVEFT